MSNIRRQSIIASLVIYFGFAIGLLNVYFFTKEGLFTTTQYGLTSIFISIATMMMAFANLAMPAYIYKFYHYYDDHLEPRKNDMITWALLMGTIGFILVAVAGWFFRDIVIRKFGSNSPELLIYYYWIFPLGFGLTIYNILEVYTWQMGKPVLTNFLREVQWRLLVTLLIVLLYLGVVKDFDMFIKLYSFTYPVIALILFIYLFAKGRIHFSFRPSKVTRRYLKKILTLCSFVYSGTLIFSISLVFDSLVIASVLKDGMEKVAIFGLATILTSVIQAPQRSIIATTLPHLSRAWKEKNQPRLQQIYQRSSINLLIFACLLFSLIALNYTEAILTFGLQQEYLLGFSAFIFLGLTRVVDLGTGVNTEIIGTSNYWRFQLVSGVILLALMLPLTYIMAKRYDILGPAIANLVSISIYNAIRIGFLWKKFRLFPFTRYTLYTILSAGISYVICYFLFRQVGGLAGLVLRSSAFLLLYLGMVIYWKFTPDIQPVLETIKKRLRFKSF